MATVRFALLTFLLGLAIVGCLSDEQKLTMVPSSPFGNSGRSRTASFKQAPAATQEIALRVDRVGKKLVAANPRIGVKVAFFSCGLPHEEIYHQCHKDVGAIYITEGLVKQCKTDGELAAVLSQELGKMMSEQMAQVKSVNRRTPPPLMNPRIGNDNNGTFGSPDGSDQMILYHYEKEREQTSPLPAAPPPASTLARMYLKDAGFDPKTLDTVAPLLRKAEKQSSMELSMTGKSND